MRNVDPPRSVKQEDDRFCFMPPPLASSDTGKSFDACMSVSDIPMAIEEETCTSLLSKMAMVSDGYEHIEAVVPKANLFVPEVPTYVQEKQAAQVEKANTFCPIEPIEREQAARNFAQELAQIYASHMPKVHAEMEAQRQTSSNFIAPINSFIAPQEETEDSDEGVITVVDFTAMAKPVELNEVAAAVAELGSVSVAEMAVAAPIAVAAPVAVAAKPTQTSSGLNAILKTRALAPVNQQVSSSWFA